MAWRNVTDGGIGLMYMSEGGGDVRRQHDMGTREVKPSIESEHTLSIISGALYPGFEFRV